MEQNNKQSKVKKYLFLYSVVVIFSLTGVMSKMAAKFDFLSPQFILYYGISLLLLLVYAVLWQQVLKKMPLALAYSNKSVGVLLSIIWGLVLFQEPFSWSLLISVAMIIAGTLCVVKSDDE